MQPTTLADPERRGRCAALGTLVSSPPRIAGQPIDIFLESLLSGILEVLVEVLRYVFGASRDPRHRAHPALAGVGLLGLGAVLGGLVTWWLPIRLLGVPAIPGASVVVSPLVNGVLMHYVGQWQLRRRLHPSFAATFWGGVLFALGFSLLRFFMLVDA